MAAYIIRRLLMTIPVMLGVATLVFSLIHMIPGDPIEVMLGEQAVDTDREALRRQLGLDKPVLEQYGTFLVGVATADLGESFFMRKPALEAIGERYGATLKLALASMLVALLIAIPAGVIAAVRQYSWLDHSTMFLALAGVSMPRFWLGPILIIIFAIKLDWFPVSGDVGFGALILPAITLGTALAAITSRMVRSSMLEVLKSEFVNTARAKGLSEPKVVLKHALRNALMPVITIVGLQFGALLSGAIITETVFAWPGVGRLLVQAINARDYPLVQACVLVISFSYVIINLITDFSYRLADPRVELEK